jgi:hypothetical protein
MYEIKITAASVNELRGRLLALVAQMTLEASSAQLTLEANSAPAPVVVVPVPEPVAVVPEPVAAAPEPVAAAPEPVAEEPVAEEPVADEAITYEQVRTAILQVSVGVGREAVGTILQHFGATRNAQEIDPSRYPEVLAMAKKTLEG